MAEIVVWGGDPRSTGEVRVANRAGLLGILGGKGADGKAMGRRLSGLHANAEGTKRNRISHLEGCQSVTGFGAFKGNQCQALLLDRLEEYLACTV